MQLENEQALISKKKVTNAFSVNRKLINSKDFRDKFDELELSPEVASKVYKEVGRLLEYVDGQENEYLVALDYNTGERIVDNFGREACARGTGFTDEEYSKILNTETNLILIHNHYVPAPYGPDTLLKQCTGIFLFLCFPFTILHAYPGFYLSLKHLITSGRLFLIV